MSLPPPLPNAAFWWKAWVASVVGAPLFFFLSFLVGLKPEYRDSLASIGVALGAISLIAHIVVSCKLAHAIVAQCAAQGRSAVAGGLIVGLLFGGWAAMFAVFFCGCLAAMVVA